MERKDGFSPQVSKIMTKEEEEELDAMVRQRRGRGMAFYNNTGPPVQRETVSLATISPSPQNVQSTSGISEPDSETNNKRIASHSSRLRIGFADTIGKRPTMEDEILIQGKLRGREDEDFVAVYDGHGGRSASEFAAKHLHGVLVQKLEEFENPEDALRQAFVTTNDMMRRDSITGGTTAIVALFLKNRCYIANAGDSRAVLCRDSKAFRLSKDHKPEDPEEEARITKAGGTVLKINNTKLGKTIGRVNGMLSVSRALGDLFLQPYVTPEPDVKRIEISSSKNQLIIMACDGLWDVISDDEAVVIATTESDPEKAAIKLRDTALSKSSTDNISVVVIRLPVNGSKENGEEKGDIKKIKGPPQMKAFIIVCSAMVFLFGILRAGKWLALPTDAD